MTIQQLEYIVAVDKYRHFVTAAEFCGVTQPTLSSMIQKFEDELGIVIFDRKSHPVKPTKLGDKVIAQAKIVLFNSYGIKEIVDSERKTIGGNLRMAIIPTVAPYILPSFIGNMQKTNPDIALTITEIPTDLIVKKLLNAEVDVAIVSTPLVEKGLLEIPLYYEKFACYVSPQEDMYSGVEVISSKMSAERLWVLREEHCLRNQVLNFCDLTRPLMNIYEAGSIDTLIKIVDTNGGYTIIPELHVAFLNEYQRRNVRMLVSPTVVREISMVVREDFVRAGVLNACADIIKSIIPSDMLDDRLKRFSIKL